MPNDWYNLVTIKHSDKKEISKIRHAIKHKKLFQTYVPNLNNKDDWYNWCVENWGTKWDIYDVKIKGYTENGIKVQFSTAWNPPIQALQTMETEFGFDITCDFVEWGCRICGHYANHQLVSYNEVLPIFDYFIDRKFKQFKKEDAKIKTNIRMRRIKI